MSEVMDLVITSLALEKLAKSRNPAEECLPYTCGPTFEEAGLRVTLRGGSDGESLFLSEQQADGVLRLLAEGYVRATLKRNAALVVAQATEAAYKAAEVELRITFFDTISAFRAAWATLAHARAMASSAHAGARDLETELSLLKQDFMRVVPQEMAFGIPVKVDGVTYGVRGAACKTDNGWLHMSLSMFVIDPAAS